MGGCQNCGPFLGTLNIRCRIIIGIQKGTIILTTTHMEEPPPEKGLTLGHLVEGRPTLANRTSVKAVPRVKSTQVKQAEIERANPKCSIHR